MKFGMDFFDDGLRRVGTRCEKWDMMQEEYGQDLLPLWVADMDFPSPPAVQQALLTRAAHPTYGYTAVLDDDYDAVINFWQRRHGLTLQKEQISLLPCVVTGLKICVQAFTQPGDGVIVQPPVYGPFYRSITVSGRKIMENPLRRDDNGRYHMDLAQLENLIQQGGKMLMLCNPHNPVSRLWSREEMQALTDLLKKYNLPLVSDEIHADFVYAPNRLTPALSLAEENDPVISLAAASKTFNLAGLQQACLFTKNLAMKEKLDETIGANGIVCANIFALEGTRAAYNHGDAWLDGLMAYLDKGREILARELARELPQAVLTPMEATYLAWIDLSAYGYSTQELTDRTHAAGVAFTEGTFFGKDAGEGFLRFNIACPHRNIIEGVKRLKKAILG